MHTRTVSPAERWGGLDHVAEAGLHGYVLLSCCEQDLEASSTAG